MGFRQFGFDVAIISNKAVSLEEEALGGRAVP